MTINIQENKKEINMNESETKMYISNIENGRMKPTLYGEFVEPISTLEKISNALGISSSELLK